MKLKQIRILFSMEQHRVNALALGVLFSVMLAFIILITLFKPTMGGAMGMGQAPLLSSALSFIYFLTVFLGITLSLLVLQELRSDYTNGVFYTMLTYPVSAGEFMVSKVLAIGTYVFLDIIIIFALFVFLSGAFLIYGAILLAALFVAVVLLLFTVMLLALILAPLAHLSPLPEMIVVGLFLGITIFSYSLPSEYLALIAPYITVIKVAGGMKVPFKEIMFAALSPFIYLALAYASCTFLNTQKRRAIR